METSVVKIITYVTYFSSSQRFFYLYLSMIKMLLKRLLKIGKSHQYNKNVQNYMQTLFQTYI